MAITLRRHANFFYKNLVWTFTLFLYQIYCNFDATLMYDYSLLMLFNLVFTSLPVAILGIVSLLQLFSIWDVTYCFNVCNLSRIKMSMRKLLKPFLNYIAEEC